MAILCFNLFILIFAFVCRKSNLISYCGRIPIICICSFAIVRILYAAEFPFAHIISAELFNDIQTFARKPVSAFSEKSTVGMCLCIVWISWAMVECFWFLWQIIKAVRSMKHAELVSDSDILSVCEQVTKQQVTIALTAGTTPYIAGFFRPIIFLPEHLNSIDELKYILMHEWQHFKSKDQWKKLFVNLLTCFFWWNPLIYLFRFDVEQMLELNCDYKVLKQLSPKERDHYLWMLRYFCDSDKKQTHKNQSLILGVVPFFKKSKLFSLFELVKQRIWLGKHYEESTPQSKFLSVALCMGILLVFLLSYTILLQPASHPPAEDGPTITEFPEGTVLEENENGTYTIVINGQKFGYIQNRSIPPFSSMPVTSSKD